MIDRSQWKSTKYYGYPIYLHDATMMSLIVAPDPKGDLSLTMRFTYYNAPIDESLSHKCCVSWRIHRYCGPLLIESFMEIIDDHEIIVEKQSVELRLTDNESGLTYSFFGANLSEVSFEALGVLDE